MPIVDLDLVKKAVRADDFDADDDYLGFLVRGAEESVVRSTGRSREELEEMNAGAFPETLKQAIIMLTGHWYNQREAVSTAQMTEVPYSMQALIKPWRKLSRDESGTDEIPAEDPEAGDAEEQLGE